MNRYTKPLSYVAPVACGRWGLLVCPDRAQSIRRYLQPVSRAPSTNKQGLFSVLPSSPPGHCRHDKEGYAVMRAQKEAPIEIDQKDQNNQSLVAQAVVQLLTSD